MVGDERDDNPLSKYESALLVFDGRGDDANDRGRYKNDESKFKVNRRGFFKDFEPTYNLDKLCKDCMKKYPMVTLMDNHHFNWRFTPKSVKETVNYITLIEATYITKKKITEAKENIFEYVEELEKKVLDKEPQLN